MKQLKKRPGALLALGCYAAALLVFLAVGLIGFIQNRAAYASGRLAPATLSLDDFEWNTELELRDGTLVSLGADPQLILKDRERAVENVTLDFGYSRTPRMQQVFWAAPGQDHALRQMAYPTGQSGEKATFLLPAAGGQSLRIDPDTVLGTSIEVRGVTINTRRPFWQFFIPSAGQLAALLLVPPLAAAALGLGLEALRLWAGKRRALPGDMAPAEEGAAHD